MLRRIVQVVFLSALFHSGVAIADPTGSIVFTCPVHQSGYLYKTMLQLYQEAFARLQLDFRFHLTDGRGSIVAAASGRSGGECARMYDYVEVTGTPNLIRLDVKTLELEIIAWARMHHSVVPTELPALKGRVGVRNEFRWIMRALSQQKSTFELQMVESNEEGLRLLVGGRLDYFVAPKRQIDDALQRLDLTNRVVAAKSIGITDMYPYLHIRHRNLAEPLKKELEFLIERNGGVVR